MNSNRKPTTWSKHELATWIKSHGSTFDEIADVFIQNGVEGDDLFDEAVFSRPSYDDMLSSVQSIFTKNKLWKKIQELKTRFSPRPTPHAFERWKSRSILPFAIRPESNSIPTQENDIGNRNSIFASGSFNSSPIR